MPGALPTLSTARLVLRSFRLSDGPDVRRLAGERAVAETTLVIPHPYPEGAAEQWIATHAAELDAGRQAHFAITSAGDGALVGAIGLMLSREHARAELGYWVGVPFWGRGYATEAARAAVGFGFGTLALHRIQARHFTFNPASGRVLQKVGMTCEGVARQAVRKWDRFEDLVTWAILSTDPRPA